MASNTSLAFHNVLELSMVHTYPSFPQRSTLQTSLIVKGGIQL